MSHSKQPQQRSTPEETFKQLAIDFEFEQKVADHILSKKIKTLKDFRDRFPATTGEDEIKTFIGEIRELPDPGLQTSKLRQAWAAVSDHLEAIANRPDIGEAELEDMLKGEDLDNRKKNFWIRYKCDFASEEYPADSLISRVARECQKRMLLVYDIATVRNLLFQITTHKKKKQAVPGADLWTHDNHEVRAPPKDWIQYLSKLYTYLLALAIAGCLPVSSAPSA